VACGGRQLGEEGRWPGEGRAAAWVGDEGRRLGEGRAAASVRPLGAGGRLGARRAGGGALGRAAGFCASTGEEKTSVQASRWRQGEIDAGEMAP